MSKKFPSARKLIGQLKDLRSHARKVYNYRCDVLDAGILEELEDYLTELDRELPSYNSKSGSSGDGATETQAVQKEKKKFQSWMMYHDIRRNRQRGPLRQTPLP